jgi:hypothetical protein
MNDTNRREHPEQHPMEQLTADIEQKQRNTTFPDLMINASDADALMWHGSPRITKIQRVGVGLFGITFLIAGIGMVSDAHRHGSWLECVVAAPFIGGGGKLLWNSIRKNAPSIETAKHG